MNPATTTREETVANLKLEAAKKFGEGAIMQGGDVASGVKVFSTGHVGINRALGVG